MQRLPKVKHGSILHFESRLVGQLLISSELLCGKQESGGKAMRSKFAQFIFAICLLIVFVPAVLAQQVSFAIPKLVVNTSFLNIRTGPGVQYAVLVTVVGGTELPVLGVASDRVWYQVNTTEGVGWVNVEFTLPRGDFSRVPVVPAPALGDPVVSDNADLGQGGGGGAPVSAMARSTRFTGVSFEGGNIHAGPGENTLLVASALGAEPNVILPLLNQQTINGIPWFQINFPPYGVVWTTKVRLRPLACAGETVGVTVGDTTIRFDGIAVRDSFTLPQGTELFIRGVSFNDFFVVEDVNQTIGVVPVNSIVLRPAEVVSRCDLIPSGSISTSAALGQGGGITPPSTDGPVFVAVAPSGNVVIVNTGNLNVRSGPSASFASIAVVSGGTQLGVVGRARDNVWLLVQGDFGRGWINSEFVLFRGVFSSVPVLTPEQYPLIVAPAVEALGQGGGGGAPAAAANVRSVRFTGVSFEGGDLFAEPRFDSIKIRSAAGGDENTILPLLNQVTVNGVQWYQVNVPPFGVGWTTNVRLRPLACGADTVAVTRFPTPMRFDGIAARDPLPLPEGAELFLRGASFSGSVLVEDINGTRGLVAADAITIRPSNVVSRCDLIPTAVTAAAAAAGNAGALQAPVTSGNIAIVNTGNLNVRSGPSANFASIAVVPGGTRLNVLARSRDNVWFFVEGPFGRGWVNNTLVIFRGVYDSIPVIN